MNISDFEIILLGRKPRRVSALSLTIYQNQVEGYFGN